MWVARGTHKRRSARNGYGDSEQKTRPFLSPQVFPALLGAVSAIAASIFLDTFEN
jgi:hypothetical protein